jgi:hypothetical protein
MEEYLEEDAGFDVENPDGTQDTELLNLGSKLSSLFSEYKDSRRETEDEWIRDLRQFSGQYDPETLARLAEASGSRSKVFVGLTRTKVMAAYSRLVDLLFQSGDAYFGVKPTPRPQINPVKRAKMQQLLVNNIVQLGQGQPEEVIRQVLAENEEKIRAGLQDQEQRLAMMASEEMQRDIEDQLIEENSEQKMKEAILEACIFGSGAVKSGTVKIDRVQSYTREEDELGRSSYVMAAQEEARPEIESVSIFDLYPDPYCTSLDDCSGMFRRHVLTRRQFRELTNLPSFDSEIILSLLKENRGGNHREEDHERTRRQIAGIQEQGDSNRYELLEFWGSIDGYDLQDAGVELPEGADPSEDYDANIWLCSGKVVKASLNPIKGYRIPYNIFPYERTPHQFWGVGVPRMMRDSQQTMNAATRIWLDNMALSSGPMVEVNTDLLAAGEDPTDLHPWRVFLRSGGDGSMPAVRYYQPVANANGLNQIIEIFRRFADETTSLPSYTHGEQTKRLNKTATGISMLMGAANVALKSTIKNIDDFLIRPMIESMFHFNMEFGTNERAKGDLKVVARGSTALVQKEVQSQRLLQFLSLVSTPMDSQLIDRGKLLRDIAKSMDIDASDVIKSQEQLLAEQQAALQQQQMLAASSEGGEGSFPNGGMADPNGATGF